MIKFYQVVATAGGIGYIGKGGGTVAAAAWCIVCFFAPAIENMFLWQVFVISTVCVLGTWSAGKVEAQWGHDSSRVVIDEVAGMMIALAFVKLTAVNIIAGLILFRFFDIVKPLYIRKAEQLPGGWGVMADDVLAGIYARALLALLQLFL
ncbi:phosphatidylglycerophosphatase A family protein [Foetidibacter luteolus]|uniref:phosphatidylglycerophosphatase A family protein n=1 Tax=Foetidibacter luteolus TaxID=2608880 RepID=UPI00129B3A20|nr:phosphatidylglycerophosphatase A [Foetidibacter luteolus]